MMLKNHQYPPKHNNSPHQNNPTVRKQPYQQQQQQQDHQQLISTRSRSFSVASSRDASSASTTRGTGTRHFSSSMVRSRGAPGSITTTKTSCPKNVDETDPLRSKISPNVVVHHRHRDLNHHMDDDESSSLRTPTRSGTTMASNKKNQYTPNVPLQSSSMPVFRRTVTPEPTIHSHKIITSDGSNQSSLQRRKIMQSVRIIPTPATANASSATPLERKKKYTRRYDWTPDNNDDLEDPLKKDHQKQPQQMQTKTRSLDMDDYDGSEITGPIPAVTAIHPTLSPLNDVVHVQVGTSTTVTHSRRQLRRASQYFRNLLDTDAVNTQQVNVLQLQGSTARDWHTLMEQYVLIHDDNNYNNHNNNKKHPKRPLDCEDWANPACTVLPDFLPWFVLLDLPPCLKAADEALLQVHQTLPTVQSYENAVDRIYICAIAKSAKLPKTMETAFFHTAQQFLDHRVYFLAKEGSRETTLLWTIAKLLVGCLKQQQQKSSKPTTSHNQQQQHYEIDEEDADDDDSTTSGGSGDRSAEEILELIRHSEHLFVPRSARLLCSAILEYIPVEALVDHLWAANRSQLLRLLQNPLFPHLLRAGILDSDENNTTFYYYGTSTSSKPDATAASIPQTLQYMLSWDNLSGTDDDNDNHQNQYNTDGTTTKTHKSSSTATQKAALSDWLQRIWNHLQRPPKLIAISNTTVATNHHYYYQQQQQHQESYHHHPCYSEYDDIYQEPVRQPLPVRRFQC